MLPIQLSQIRKTAKARRHSNLFNDGQAEHWLRIGCKSILKNKAVHYSCSCYWSTLQAKTQSQHDDVFKILLHLQKENTFMVNSREKRVENSKIFSVSA